MGGNQFEAEPGHNFGGRKILKTLTIFVGQYFTRSKTLSEYSVDYYFIP